MSSLLLLHAAATLAMTGVIWFVQVVHYPLFPSAAIGDFAGFARSHQTRTSWLVVPLMAAELGTAVALAATSPEPTRALALWGLALLATIWLSTALIQVPLHRSLSLGFDSAVARQLVRTNWIRTAAWSARSVLALALLSTA